MLQIPLNLHSLLIRETVICIFLYFLILYLFIMYVYMCVSHNPCGDQQTISGTQSCGISRLNKDHYLLSHLTGL